MENNTQLIKAALSTGLLALGQAFVTAGAQPQDRPNILWIVSEDNTVYLGCYGDSVATTPNIDRMASKGILYSNAFCTVPVSAPARSTLITGMFPPSLGTQHMRSKNTLPSFLKFYTEYMRAAGYYCVNNSKTDYNTNYEYRDEFKNAWDESSNNAWWKNRAPNQPFFQIVNIGTTHESSIFKIPDRLRHDPAKVILPPFLPDLPEERIDRALYYDRLEEMDAKVGDLLDKLKSDGLAENTIVFYYGDNGGVLGRSKRFTYDDGLHIPLIIYFPEKYLYLAPSKPGTQIDRLVSFVDFAPTMLNLLGIEIPDYMQGEPFLGCNQSRDRDYIYAFRGRMDERYDMCRVVRGKRYKYIRNYMPHRPWGQHVNFLWRAGGMQAWEKAYREGKCNEVQSMFWQNKPAEELYDIMLDPHETNNLVGSPEHAGILEEMREAHRRWELDIYDTGFIPEGEMAARVDGSAPYDLVRSSSFPYRRLYETADRATLGRPEDFDLLVSRLSDSEAAVRYWAVTGCIIQPEKAESVREELIEIAENDPSGDVRIAAAEALFNMKEAKKAVKLLLNTVKTFDAEFIRLHAFNTADIMGEAADNVRKYAMKTYPEKQGSGYDERIVWYWRQSLK